MPGRFTYKRERALHASTLYRGAMREPPFWAVVDASQTRAMPAQI